VKIIKSIKVGLCALFLFVSFDVLAIDAISFNKIANDTIKQMNSGVVGDIDALIAMQEQLMILGVEGGVEHLQESPKDARALMLVIDNAEAMKSLSLDEIEDLWHGGNYLKGKGVDLDGIDHFGPTNSLMDAVIHPATSYLLLKQYKETGDSTLLARVTGELLEVIEHIKHVGESVQVAADP